MCKLVLVALAALLACPTIAQTEQFYVDGRQINLPKPDGYCYLKRDHPSGLFLYTAMNQLLYSIGGRAVTVVLPCSDLESLKGGRILSRYGVWATFSGLTPQKYTRHRFVREYLERWPKVNTEEIASIADRNIGRLGTCHDTMAIELIDNNNQDAVYFRTLAHASVLGQKMDQATVSGLTVIGDRVLQFGMGQPFQDGSTFSSLLEEVKKVISVAVEADVPAENGAIEKLPEGMEPPRPPMQAQ